MMNFKTATLAILGLVSVTSALAGQLTVRLTLSVESVCLNVSPSAELLAIKCTARAPAPMDPRLVPGVGFGTAWVLASHTRSLDGAELYHYQPAPVEGQADANTIDLY